MDGTLTGCERSEECNSGLKKKKKTFRCDHEDIAIFTTRSLSNSLRLLVYTRVCITSLAEASE